ncbi:uncharacterized protein BP5553_08576 [Venustampulla echinocandica]|uniref:Uncharacterized protein n=1 Tax=Venustampulla echinocandica TaxID=2656787 RepID=A0A370TEL5_9HELO|nr:uncharacterized protein BP5553_08576 [Venustampulla echinocandica]RDL33137.1 hypothetical protein BP5553_08576 [Venustampulla echinocandica]
MPDLNHPKLESRVTVSQSIVISSKGRNCDLVARGYDWASEVATQGSWIPGSRVQGADLSHIVIAKYMCSRVAAGPSPLEDSTESGTAPCRWSSVKADLLVNCAQVLVRSAAADMLVDGASLALVLALCRGWM